MAKNISSSLQETTFELWYKGKNEGLIAISLFGEHNVLNALGAIAIAYRLGINFDSIKRAIVNCKHIGRRQQLLYQKDSFVIISDYAHHPTAISATISSIANIYPGRRLVVIYQPHRYSRTRYSWPNFLHAFNLAESLYLAPIYSAGETEIEGISSERLCTDINNIHPGLATMMYDFNLDKLIATNTVLLCMGAGNISSKVEKWIQHLS
jgi:UDP-N-acetylmuramate--alanine ligase